MSIEHKLNDTDRRNPEYPEKTLSQCHFVHHKSHTDRPGTEPTSNRLLHGTWPSILYHLRKNPRQRICSHGKI